MKPHFIAIKKDEHVQRIENEKCLIAVVNAEGKCVAGFIVPRVEHVKRCVARLEDYPNCRFIVCDIIPHHELIFVESNSGDPSLSALPTGQA